jgi:hypothetical protein
MTIMMRSVVVSMSPSCGQILEHVAAIAGVANSAGSRIVARPFIRIVLALTTNSEESACCARQ